MSAVRCLRGAAGALALAATLPVLSALPASASADCARAPLPAAAYRTIPAVDPDQDLFNRAIVSEVNYYRCTAGLKPLRLADGLARVASTHARWMAEAGKLSHRSTVPGLSSVQERVLASGLTVRLGSENIGYLPRYRFGDSRKIRIRDKARCEFTTAGGRRIAPHSYASLAADIVKLWMRSPAHRQNLLDRRVRVVGAALDFDPQGIQCGQFYMAQNFAG